MTLEEYLLKARLTKQQFANLAGIAVSTLKLCLKGNKPSFLTACKIEKATNKKITVEQLLD